MNEASASTPGTPGTKKKPCALPLNQRREADPVLVHSGALLAILQLLPSMFHPKHQVHRAVNVENNYHVGTC